MCLREGEVDREKELQVIKVTQEIHIRYSSYPFHVGCWKVAEILGVFRFRGRRITTLKLVVSVRCPERGDFSS